ncbi:unnamed protein product [Pleuronectes platessa]|uniref:Uncharacterized protein n=1 Tax=Pleuronectes platessa TaxID=8262 RepID=A0A9N7YZQ9_PLEPL|nr:unnamed protein product [Pleuronectes platessa]
MPEDTCPPSSGCMWPLLNRRSLSNSHFLHVPDELLGKWATSSRSKGVDRADLSVHPVESLHNLAEVVAVCCVATGSVGALLQRRESTLLLLQVPSMLLLLLPLSVSNRKRTRLRLHPSVLCISPPDRSGQSPAPHTGLYPATARGVKQGSDGACFHRSSWFFGGAQHKANSLPRSPFLSPPSHRLLHCALPSLEMKEHQFISARDVVQVPHQHLGGGPAHWSGPQQAFHTVPSRRCRMLTLMTEFSTPVSSWPRFR